MSSAITDQGARVIEEEPLPPHKYNETLLDDELVQLHRENDAIVRQEHDNDAHFRKLDDFYCLHQTVDLLCRFSRDNTLRSVALQFPDNLLPDAARVCKRLHALLRQRFPTNIARDSDVDTVESDSAQTHRTVVHTVKTKGTVGDIEDAIHGDTNRNQESATTNLSRLEHADTNTVEPVAAAIQELEAAPEVYIMGDTTYASCCVDEVAAQHARADFIIHYGNACLQPVKRTPVHHVFGKSYTIDVEQCEQSLRAYAESAALEGKGVVVLYDLVYYRTVRELEGKFDHNRVAFARLDPARVTQNVSREVCEAVLTSDQQHGLDNSQSLDINGLRVSIPPHWDQGSTSEQESDSSSGVSPFKIFYIGEDGVRLTQLMMDHSTVAFARFSGVSNTFDDGSLATSRLQRLLKRRYFMMHQAMDAQVFGIIVATVSVANYMDILKHVQEQIKSRSKKSYVFYVGKLNVPKLANFAEVDAFVLISCNQNSLIDSREFYKPIVTPFELEMAMKRGTQWTGRYVTDFNKLLDMKRDAHSQATETESESNNHDGDDQEVDYSFISRTVRSHYGNQGSRQEQDGIDSRDAAGSLELVGRTDADGQQLSVIATQSPAMRFLNESRTFRGLEQNLGETPVVDMVEGRSGLAKSYTHEQQQ